MLSARLSSWCVCSEHAPVPYSRSFLFYVDYFYLLTVHFLCRNFPGNSFSLSSATLPLILIPTPYKLFSEIPTHSHLSASSEKIKFSADNLCFLLKPLIFLSPVSTLLTIPVPGLTNFEPFLSNCDNFFSLLPNGESYLPILEWKPYTLPILKRFTSPANMLQKIPVPVS